MKGIIKAAVGIFLFLLLVYIGAQILTYFYPQNNALWERFSNTISFISAETWNFKRPFLQLIIILLILEWLLAKFGIKLIPEQLKIDLNIQTVIALIVVVAFCIAALGNIPGMGALKDLAFVVVGFYFGVNKKPKTENINSKVEKSNNGG